MSIKIKFKGFEDTIQRIKNAGGSVDKAVETCMKQSADIVDAELKSQMQAAAVPAQLITAMSPPRVFRDGNTFVAKVGYEKGEFDPKNPSDAYKIVFLNYGTPKRMKHGKVKARGFIQKARRKALPKVKKQQEQMLNEILARLEE